MYNMVTDIAMEKTAADMKTNSSTIIEGQP